MDNLFYSDEAQDILNLFYQSDVMVYVEGPDDVCFWEIIFKKTSTLNVEVQDVGGCHALEEYIDKIRNNKIRAIVACDSDFRGFSGETLNHNNIIYTNGYSIENTFINKASIIRTIKTLGKYSTRDLQRVEYSAWLDDFSQKICTLVKLDILNHINKSGCSVLDVKADRFMKAKPSFRFCEDKITSYFDGLPSSLKEANLEEIDMKLTLSNIMNWLRGHFLFSAIARFISGQLARDGRKTNISTDALYSNLLTSFELLFNQEDSAFNHYYDKINLISIH